MFSVLLAVVFSYGIVIVTAFYNGLLKER